MRIGIVSQWFPPEGARIVEAWAVELVRRGHEVHVVTGFPNYPTGQVYDGYKITLYKREKWRGATVHRGPLYPSHDGNPAKRFLNYFTFALGSVITGLRVPRVDVWITNCTPATASALAITQKAIRKTPTVTVVQDLWPDSVLDSGFLPAWLNKILRPPIDYYCNLTYRFSDVIGVISPGMASVLENRGVPLSKLDYMPNGVPDVYGVSLTSPAMSRAELGLPSGRLFMYAGNIGPLQNLESLVDAFREESEAELVIVGSGVSDEAVREKAAGATNIRFVGRVPPSEIANYISNSDVQIVSLADSPLLRVTMPSKVQTALAAGKPILASAAGDVAHVVSELGAGLAAAPSDISSTVKVVREFLDMDTTELAAMGGRARMAYESTYSVQEMVNRLEVAVESARAKPRW